MAECFFQHFLLDLKFLLGASLLELNQLFQFLLSLSKLLGSLIFLLPDELNFLPELFFLLALAFLLPLFFKFLLFHQLAVAYTNHFYGGLDKFIWWKDCFDFDFLLLLGVIDCQKRVVFFLQFMFPERFKPEITKQLLIFTVTCFRIVIHFILFGKGFGGLRLWLVALSVKLLASSRHWGFKLSRQLAVFVVDDITFKGSFIYDSSIF